ncbi:VCBS repeat-containing protein [Streptomyces sp. NPDC089919]|uniref:VCBS repeat-containing protein n=1 Tax=Streptomyces sp. NPDC089919 TaxID=3155188 RepID=UPI0034201226
MNSLRHSARAAARRGLLTACTALALSAGTLLPAGPAVADGGRPALPALRLLPPQHGGPAAAGYAAGAAAATVKPRLDADRDGRPDALFRDADGRVGVTLSTTGQQVDFNIQTTDMAEVAKDIVPVGDLGGDKNSELLTLSGWGILSLHSTTGPYNAGRRTWAGGGWGAYNKLLAPGDLTRDGRPDLLARTPSGSLYLYRSTGALTGEPFAPRVYVGAGWGAYDQLVGGNDLDRDGIGDLLAKTPTGDLYFYKGTGSATAPFRARVKVGPGWNAYNQLAGADDLDGDGRADLVARAFDGTLWLYRSTGSGVFTARAKYGTGGEALRFLGGHGGVPDYGKHSVLAREADGQLYEYLELANGTFRRRASAGYEHAFTGRPVAAAGLDLRDEPHLLRLGTDTVHDYDTEADLTGDWTGAKLLLGVGDLTGDGKGDLLTRDAAGVLWLHPGDGRGLATTARVRVGPGWNGYDRLLGAGDFSGDGRTDLIARDTAGRVWLYTGTGSAAAPFAARAQIGTGWGGYDELAATGDLNGDGRADLIARDTTGTVYRYTATGLAGTATFGPRVKLATGWGAYTHLG